MMMHGTYVGQVVGLLDKTALLMNNRTPGEYLAQFDNVATGFGYGWHRFPCDAFVLDCCDPEAN